MGPQDGVDYVVRAVDVVVHELGRRDIAFTLMGRLGRARVEEDLAWSHQQNAYLDVYRELVSGQKTTLDRNEA